jgi:hypothetical protein
MQKRIIINSWALIFFLILSTVVQAYNYQKFSLQDSRYSWMDEQIEWNFSLISFISDNDLNYVWSQIDQARCIRYQIIDSVVHGPSGNIKELLKLVCTYYTIPDVDFIYFISDQCSSYTSPHIAAKFFPLFGASTERTSQSPTILFVEWNYDITNHDSGWNAILKISMQNQTAAFPWEQKIAKALWRGIPSDANRWYSNGKYDAHNWTLAPRGKLVYISHYESPDLIDAAFTPFEQHASHSTDNYDLFISHTPLKEMPPLQDRLRYKYQINLDGSTCTWPGFQQRLCSGSLTFKQNSDHIMWFYSGLKPWIHYIPFNEDCSDIIEKICWAKEHDAQAHTIAMNAYDFVINNMQPEHILLYTAKLLTKYASLQTFKPLKPTSTDVIDCSH